MTLNWTLDITRGTMRFGKLMPMAGSVYTIDVDGLPEGTDATFYVMTDDATVCLARGEKTQGVYSIAFNSSAIREEFDREWHETRMFHVVAKIGTNAVAEADLTVVWNPLWTDPGTSDAYTMRGPRGYSPVSAAIIGTNENGDYKYRLNFEDGRYTTFLVPRGVRGAPADTTYAYDDTDHLYHKVTVLTNRYGEKVVSIDPNGIATPPSSQWYATVQNETLFI